MPERPPPLPLVEEEEKKASPSGEAYVEASPEEKQKIDLIDAAYVRYVDHLNKCLEEEESEEGTPVWAGEGASPEVPDQEYLEEGKRIMEAAAKRIEDEEDREDEFEESRGPGEEEEEKERLGDGGGPGGLDMQIENRVVSLEKYHHYMQEEYGEVFEKGLAVIRAGNGTPLYEDIDPGILARLRTMFPSEEETVQFVHYCSSYIILENYVKRSASE